MWTQVSDSDRGTQIGEPERRQIDEIVNKLETLCIPEPLSSPLLFGGNRALISPSVTCIAVATSAWNEQETPNSNP